MNKRIRYLLAAAVSAAIGTNASAAVITQTLGDADFANGQVLSTPAFNTGSTGEPSPFGPIPVGSGDLVDNFSGSWTFNFGAIADPITSATILIGLFDGDSAAPGSQVASFTLGGVDLTTLLNAAMEAAPGATGEEVYYTVALPGAAFTALATGAAAFSLALQGPGLAALGPTDFNPAGLDFSTLTVETQTITPPPNGVPEPGTWAMLGLGLAGLVGFRRLGRRA